MNDSRHDDTGLDPTAELTQEHEVVLLVVAAMEREATRIRAGEQIDGEAVEKMVTFTREFTDGCHHTKEEKALFPLAERSLGAGDKAALAAEFERVEREETGEGVHEKYHALARELSHRD